MFKFFATCFQFASMAIATDDASTQKNDHLSLLLNGFIEPEIVRAPDLPAVSSESSESHSDASLAEGDYSMLHRSGSENLFFKTGNNDLS